MGATSNAKRVAMAHVAFNATTGVVALLTLPLLLVVVDRFRHAFGLGAGPAAVVASFHTLFNLLGVALMWPLTARLVAFLETRFRTRDEDEGRPRYLDRNILSTPILAVGALGLELARIGGIACEMAQRALKHEATTSELARRRETLGQLLAATGEFVTELQHLRLPADLGPALPRALRVGRYYAESAELAQAIHSGQRDLEVLAIDLSWRVRQFELEVLSLLDLAKMDPTGKSSEAASRALSGVEENYHDLKDFLLQAGAEGRVPVATLVAHLDRLSNVRRLAEQMERGARYLQGLAALAAGEEDELKEGIDDSPSVDSDPSDSEAVSWQS
jgi:phosphate:Na+ symporter